MPAEYHNVAYGIGVKKFFGEELLGLQFPDKSTVLGGYVWRERASL